MPFHFCPGCPVVDICIYGEAIIINRVASVLLGFTTGTRRMFARKLARNIERTDERVRGASTCLPQIVAGALSPWERTIIANSTADVDGYVRANRRIAVACPALIKSHLNYKFVDKSCPTLGPTCYRVSPRLRARSHLNLDQVIALTIIGHRN